MTDTDKRPCFKHASKFPKEGFCVWCRIAELEAVQDKLREALVHIHEENTAALKSDWMSDDDEAGE